MTENKDSSPAAAEELLTYTLNVQDMSCEHCRQTVESAAKAVAGVVDAQVDLAAATLQVRGGNPQAVMAAVQAAGYPASMAQQLQVQPCPLPGAETRQEKEKPAAPLKTILLRVGDMHCASCVGTSTTARDSKRCTERQPCK